MMKASAALALLCAFGVCGCAAPVAVLPKAEPGRAAENPSAVYEAVRRREDSIHTLRARFSAEVHRGDDVRHAEGVLLVKKPERFRLRLLSPFGFTVFDYTSWGAHARMDLPLEGKQLSDAEIANQSAFSPADLRQAFLRGDAAFPGECTPHAATVETLVDCRETDGTLSRVLHIQSSAQTISQEISFVGDQPHLIMAFADYRPVDGVPLPFSIDLVYPERAVRLRIALRGYEVNPDLPDELFAAPPEDARAPGASP